MNALAGYPEQVLPDPSNALAPLAAKDQPALAAMTMGGGDLNALALLALMGQQPTMAYNVQATGPQATGRQRGRSGGGDRDILAKTLQAEAGGEGPEGMLAAGAIIANRVRAGGYGDGFNGVIMKPGQFSAWNGVTGYAGGQGAINMAGVQPSPEAYRIADLILAGGYNDPTGGATHYYNPAAANPAWGAGGNWQRIGNHVFGFAN